ncbi:MAG: riboflavin synthase [Pirellulales bacterium]|nr:riboflavin synthase [Pirellulales bacterium]
MFTGLVQSLAEVRSLERIGPGVRLVVADRDVSARTAIGGSVAVNGCCLTAVTIAGDELGFDAGEETLRRTNLGQLKPGDRVNLETSLRMGDELGGHLVTGHIDGVGAVAARHDDGQWCTMRFSAPGALLVQMASKGSVAVDGVSLTLVDVTDAEFSVALIPHTLAATTLGLRQIGDAVNLETDVLAKYVEKQLQGRRDA